MLVQLGIHQSQIKACWLRGAPWNKDFQWCSWDPTGIHIYIFLMRARHILYMLYLSLELVGYGALHDIYDCILQYMIMNFIIILNQQVCLLA